MKKIKNLLSVSLILIFSIFIFVGCDFLNNNSNNDKQNNNGNIEQVEKLSTSDLQTICNKGLDFIESEHENFLITAPGEINYSNINVYFNENRNIKQDATLNVSYTENNDELAPLSSDMFEKFEDTRETLQDRMARTALNKFLYGDIMIEVVNNLDIFVQKINEYPETIGSNPYVVYNGQQKQLKIHVQANNNVVLFKIAVYTGDSVSQIIFISIIYDSQFNYNQVIFAAEVNKSLFSVSYDPDGETAFIYRIYDVESSDTYVLVNDGAINLVKQELNNFVG